MKELIEEIKDRLFYLKDGEATRENIYTIGLYLFYSISGERYETQNLASIPQIREVGVYQFLRAVLVDKRDDREYLIGLLELYEKEIELFEEDLDGLILDRYSTVGLIRDVNQDNLSSYISDDLIILLVADGVGGGEQGEIASFDASNFVMNTLKEQEYRDKSSDEIESILRRVIMEANDLVIFYADRHNIEKIGTTLSLLLIYNTELYIAHVGDSRIYIRRDGDDNYRLITQDHSYPEVLFRLGKIKEDEKNEYKKSILVYVIGKRNLKEENIYIHREEDIGNFDRLFLCSDGIWDIIDESSFDKDMSDLKKEILNKIPNDNSTLIRCQFHYIEKSDSRSFIKRIFNKR